MQFYLQAAVVERGVDTRHYSMCRLDVIVGCIVTDVIAFFIVVSCGATIYHTNHPEITDVAQAAVALAPFAGKFASLLFAIGLINASLLSAAIFPLATSYNICEGLGFESGVDKRFSEAPIFYWLYTLLVFGAAGVVLIPNSPAVEADSLFQRCQRYSAPVCGSLHAYAGQPPRLMGTFKNKPWQNWIAWSTAIIMISLTAFSSTTPSAIWESLTLNSLPGNRTSFQRFSRCVRYAIRTSSPLPA